MRMAIESSFLKPRHQNASQTMRMAIDCILIYLKISEKKSAAVNWYVPFLKFYSIFFYHSAEFTFQQFHLIPSV